MKTIFKKYIVKTWDELTEEEKEKKKDEYYEQLMEDWSDVLYNDFEEELADIQCRYSNIKFKDVYLRDNSQGWWIDEIKDFIYQVEDVKIYGEWISLDDINLKIGTTINFITADDINIYEYNIDDDKLKKIKATKKYKKWADEIVKDVNNWINEINEVCINYINNLYDIPDDFINDYFINNEIDFEYYADTVVEDEVND